MTSLRFDLEGPLGPVRVTVEPVSTDDAAWLLDALGCDVSMGDELDVGADEATPTEVDEDLEADIREALLEGLGAPNRIARRLRVSESRVRDALGSLRKRGLVVFDRQAGLKTGEGWRLAEGLGEE